jgi:glutamate synthase (NADPH/NADH) small chain
VILGGGDTGSDCLGTAHRQGASEVVQVELLPAPPSSRARDNPWPQWPLIFRTSSSQEEGGERGFGLLTKRLTGENGALQGLHAVKVELARGDDGRTRLVELPGSETTLEVDLLILALGFLGPETDTLAAQLGVALDPRGNVKVDAQLSTNVPGVYSAGDADRGASLIVWAISEGREAARGIDTALSGRTQLPTRGAHLPFGGR